MKYNDLNIYVIFLHNIFIKYLHVKTCSGALNIKNKALPLQYD